MPRRLPKVRTSAPPLSVLRGATELCLATVRRLSAGMTGLIPRARGIQARAQEAQAKVGAAWAELADRGEKALIGWLGDPQPPGRSARRTRRRAVRLVVPTRDL